MLPCIAMPRIMRIGAGVSGTVGELLVAQGLSRPLIVTDRFLVEQGRVDQMLAALAAAGVDAARVFADCVSDPTDASILQGIEFLRAGTHDCVIGLGGGSPLDTAKAIAVFSGLPGAIRDYRAPHSEDRPGLPIIAIPTTAGTGSEATRFTIVTDEASNEKLLCAGLAYLPIAALVDYELTMTMPARLTADTGIDSLTHAIEAYVSRRANDFSDTFALRAISAIAPNIRTAVREPDNRAAREAMMLGANFAGIAFSNASVALVHGMSRPVGAFFHVPHGLSNAMLLPVVTSFSAPSALARYATCARAMGVARAEEGDQACVARLLEELSLLNADLEVPSPARFGIAKSAWDDVVDVMAEQALASGSPSNNPIVPTAAEIRALYQQAYD
ncbi:MAG: iron-containing alcohol dehydrogenase [Sphingomonadales bacterium]